MDYIIDDSVNGIKLTGYVPKVNFIECIRLICEASCCICKKERNGKTKILKLSNNGISNFFESNYL